MKSASRELAEVKVAERAELAKKLYRYVTDVTRRIGEKTLTCNSIKDLFSTSNEIQRQKLRDNCEKLLFLDSVNYGKKSLELLWRKVYYETVCAAKKIRETDTQHDSYLFTHIVCGIGHFHHLLTRIQSEMSITCNYLDYAIMNDDEVEEVQKELSEEEQQVGLSVIHLCLIYLGDLSRYQVDIFQSTDPSIAARYYLQAAQVDLSSGMPYNQLGNLFMDKNYNLDSVSYYIHCLSCASPFEGALGNLMKIFEKNNQFCDALQTNNSASQAEHIQNMIANFLSLIEIWYLGKNDTNIPQRCSILAQQLKIALDFERTPLPDINKNYCEYTHAVEEENINPSFLNANLLHKMVVICLFTMAKVLELDEVKAFACKAFSLALLSQLLQKLLKQIESLGFKNPAHKYKPKIKSAMPNGDTEELETNKEENSINKVEDDENETGDAEKETTTIELDKDLEKNVNGDVKNAKKTLKRRRRRRIGSSGSSDVSNEETESSEDDFEESSLNEDDLSDSSYNSEEDSKSDESENENNDTNKQNCVNNKHEECPEDSHNVNTEELSVIDLDKADKTTNEIELNKGDVHSFLLGNNFLASIKLLQDWILTEKDLILSCGNSGEALFQCVVDLLNIFTFYFTHRSKETYDNEKCRILDSVKQIAKTFKLEYKSVPLPEDVYLRGTSIGKFDNHAAEWQLLEKFKPSLYEENVIRILTFIDFGNQIAKLVPRIRYNRSMKIFYIKKTIPPKVTTKVNHKRNREWHNSKKHGEGAEGGLLRRLGKLWLASQVRELERSGRAARGASAPTLLALDCAALHRHLKRIKQLLRTKNFILLVPTVVLQELDELKREQSSARDAIRWLETQLRSGSRLLRAQRPGQARPLPLLKYPAPRKAPAHVHNFIQILEFCYHFVGDEKQIQGGNGDPENTLPQKTPPLLILLVGNDPASSEEQYKEFSVTGAARVAGISIENIGDFYTKWRHSIHKNGKKR